MRYLKIHTIINILATCLLMSLASCDNGLGLVQKNAIGFSFSGKTRAGETENIATFWGYNSTDWVYSGAYAAADLTPSNGFQADLSNATIVPTNETFKNHMANNLEYWQADNYYFYSLWPSVDIATNVYKETTNSIAPGLHFYLNTTNNKNDVLFAYVNIPAEEAVVKNTPVDFEYSHVLSKVKFNIKKPIANADNVVKLKSFTIYGVSVSGYCHYENSATPRWSYDDTTHVSLYTAGDTDGKEIDATMSGTLIDNDGFLMIPQTIPLNRVKIKFTYSFKNSDNSEVIRNIDVNLPRNTIKAWEQNKEYTYNIYLAAESNDIYFGTPDVRDWPDEKPNATIIIQ